VPRGGCTTERGAAGLEYGGIIAAAALVVAAVLFGIVQADLAKHTTNAICRIFLGEGLRGHRAERADRAREGAER
jgi:Flp pilus assembly pilin Flp